MKGLLTLVMKGRTHAIMGTVITAMLALLITPLAVVSAGLVVVATLRNGAREGALVVLMSTLALAGLGMLIFQAPLAVAGLGLLIWLPAWGLASVLGASGSLTRAMEAAVLAGFGLVVAQYLVLGEPATFWAGLMQEYMRLTLDPSVVPEEEQRKLLAAMAGWMPGGVAASWTLAMLLALLFGRWGQALLDRPGGFGEEFRRLRTSRVWLFVLPVLLAGSMLGEGANLSGQLYVVGMVLFLMQGLSVAHGLIALTGAGPGWLFGLYFLLIVGMPHSVTAIAVAGYADGWLDLRVKLRGTRRPPGSG